MNNVKHSASNAEKMDFLQMILNENKQQAKKEHAIYYSISLVRFGGKIPVAHREPSSIDIKAQIEKYSATSHFNPDQIIVELYTARSRNVKPFAVYRFEYKGK